MAWERPCNYTFPASFTFISVALIKVRAVPVQGFKEMWAFEKRKAQIVKWFCALLSATVHKKDHSSPHRDPLNITVLPHTFSLCTNTIMANYTGGIEFSFSHLVVQYAKLL